MTKEQFNEYLNSIMGSVFFYFWVTGQCLVVALALFSKSFAAVMSSGGGALIVVGLGAPLLLAFILALLAYLVMRLVAKIVYKW